MLRHASAFTAALAVVGVLGVQTAAAQSTQAAVEPLNSAAISAKAKRGQAPGIASGQVPGPIPGHAAPSGQPGSPPAMSPPGQVITEAKTDPGRYVDPTRGFFMPVPPGSRVISLAGKAGLSVQSRRGYAINIQTGDTNPEMDLVHMVAKLDERYVGHGKPWRSKLMESETQVGGMAARQALYDAGAMQVRMVIARAKRTDFVFMFFAPKHSFERMHPEFEWLLGHFQPAPDDRPERIADATPTRPPTKEIKKPPLHTAAKPKAMADGRPQRMAAAAPTGRSTNRFDEPGFGYAIDYPADWEMEKAAAYTTVFSGRQGTPAYDAIVSVQNVQPARTSQAEDAVRLAFNDLKAQLSAAAEGLAINAEKDISYAKGGLKLAGRQFVATYSHGGRAFRKWALVLPRPEGDIAHVWSYTAPASRFDDFRPVAETMLRSWIIAN